MTGMKNFLASVSVNLNVRRPELFSNVEKTLKSEGYVILYGKGGTGKTQLALEFCYKYRSDHPDALIIWITAGTKHHFEERLREIATSLSILDQTNLSKNVASWLQRQRQDDWILILDDIGPDFYLESSDLACGAEPYLGPSPTCLFRSFDKDKKTLEESLTNAFQSKQALVLVQFPTKMYALEILRKQFPNTGWDEKAAGKLVSFLELSPLAITIAAAYITDVGIIIDQYLELLEGIGAVPKNPNVPTPIFRALTLCIRNLQSERPQALDISCLIAVLDRQSIIESLLFYSPKRKDARNFYGSLRRLKALSLITHHVEDGTYSMQRMVQDFFVSYLRNEGKLEVQQQFAVKLLSERYPFGDQSLWTACQLLNPHAEKVISYDGQAVWPRAELIRGMASYYQKLGRYTTAYKRFMQAHEIYASHTLLSEKDEEIMLDISLQAVQLLGLDSKFTEGIKLLEDTKKSFESRMQPGSSGLINARSLEAWFYSWQGNFKEAERLWRLCLEENIELHYEYHVDSLIYESNITTTLIEQGRYVEAEQLLDRTIRGRTLVRGKDHPDTIQSNSILAVVYHRQGKFLEAEKLNQMILEIANRVQGTEHPDTLTILSNLSMNLSALGNFSEAETMQKRLLIAGERQLGSEHEKVMNTRVNLAVTLEKLGKYPEAEEQNRLALVTQRKLFPAEDHPRTLNILNSLALVLMRQGKEKYAEAETIVREVLEKRTVVLGPEHLQTMISKNNLAGLLMKQQKYQDSQTLFHETMNTATRTLGTRNSFTLRVTNSLSDVMREGILEVEEGKRRDVLEKAEQLQREALAGRIEIFGEDHPDVFTSQYNLAHLLQNMERREEALPWYEKAAEGLERKLGVHHFLTVDCKRNFDLCKREDGI